MQAQQTEPSSTALYGGCQKHSFYALGDDNIRCCAEMSCPYYINKHRS